MENKNGQGIFYGVIGVATLIVAIIGATFAFFSASGTVTGGDNAIAGGTNDSLAGALSATVEKVNLQSLSSVANDSLVPTNLASNSEIGVVQAAVAANCVNAGYTGCHLYRITASATQDIANATLKIDSLTVTLNSGAAANKTDWQYIALSGAGTDSGTTVTANSLALISGSAGTFDATDVVLHNNVAMTTGTNYVYYLLVFLHDDNTAQNDGTSANDATGTYSGVVSLAAAGSGEVKATFTASNG